MNPWLQMMSRQKRVVAVSAGAARMHEVDYRYTLNINIFESDRHLSELISQILTFLLNS